MNLSTRKMATAVAKRYERDFAPLQRPTALRQRSTGDIRVLFRAASMVASYFPDGPYMAAMSMDLKALEGRKADTSADDAHMDEAYIAGRDFDAASALRRRHPGVGSGILPRIVDRRVDRVAPSDLVLSADTRTLIREASPLHGERIIVLSSPLCHFCQNASRALDADPRFQALLHKYATWLIFPDTSTFELIHTWNKRHPFEAMKSMYAPSEWTKIDDIATPMFYFFDGPHLLTRVTGWGPEGNKPAILAAMRKLGIPVPAVI
jgi:hypothetical protein